MTLRKFTGKSWWYPGASKMSDKSLCTLGGQLWIIIYDLSILRFISFSGISKTSLNILQICSSIIIFASPNCRTWNSLNIASLTGATMWAHSFSFTISSTTLCSTRSPIFPSLPHFCASSSRLEKIQNFWVESRH